jgi:hypothetical protein
VRSIVNVPHWLTLCIAPLLLSGCAGFSLFGERERPITVETKAVERTRLNLPDPAPLSPRTTRWIVITPENAEQVWRELREKNIDLVLFAVTDDGYEEMAMTQAEIRNYINAQRQIIIKYREYYEPVESKQSK